MALTQKRTGITDEEARAAAETYCKAQQLIKKNEAAIAEKITKIKSAYADAMIELAKESEEAETILEQYANEQAGNWSGKKSLDLVHCFIGFRLSPPKVTKPEKSTWETITHTIARYFPKLIRTEQFIDKEAILALQGAPEFKKLHDKTGIEVVQEESFYVRLKSK